jgi:peroxin-5
LEKALAEAWESGQMEGGEVNYEDIWSKAMQDAGLEGAWGEGGGAMEQAWGAARADPNAYAMEEENKYRDKEGMFDRGMELFQAGEIEEAVLAFQAHIQKHPEDCSESWRMLGSCHQEQDEDRRAIISLEKAVEQDPCVTRGGWRVCVCVCEE